LRLISVDQSTSHCAVIFWEDERPIEKRIIKTGSTHSKTKSKGVQYFPIITQQIDFVCSELCTYVYEFSPDYFVYESPAMGSYGDAKATLLTLFRAIKETLIEKTNLTDGQISSYTPTAVKSFARQFLPEEEQVVNGKKRKMEKKDMVKACELTENNFLEGLTLSQGKADYADAYFIGLKFINEYKEGKMETTHTDCC
jgi:hypothetical protein